MSSQSTIYEYMPPLQEASYSADFTSVPILTRSIPTQDILDARVSAGVVGLLTDTYRPNAPLHRDLGLNMQPAASNEALVDQRWEEAYRLTLRAVGERVLALAGIEALDRVIESSMKKDGYFPDLTPFCEPYITEQSVEAHKAYFRQAALAEEQPSYQVVRMMNVLHHANVVRRGRRLGKLLQFRTAAKNAGHKVNQQELDIARRNHSQAVDMWLES